MTRPSHLWRRTVLVLTVSLVLPLGAVGCRNTPETVAGRLSVSAGQAEVGRPGEERREVTGSSDLRVGDGVRVRQGSAVIRLAGGRELELRAGTDLELRATDGGDRSRPTLLSGDLLVRSPQQPLRVVSVDEYVVVRGDMRISRGLALVAAAYEGSATVSSAGKSIIVPALRQVAIPAAGLFPVRPAPLVSSPDDEWDQRYLSGAIGLSEELRARSRGFSAQVPEGDGQTVNYFRDLLPQLAGEPAFRATLLDPRRPPGETLVGAAIALEGTKGLFADRWSAVFGFHDDGAPWGLVALDQGVSRVRLLATIEGAVRRGPTSFALAQPGAAPTSLPPPATRPSPTTVVTTPTTVGRSQPTTPTTTTRLQVPTPTTVGPPGPLNTGTPVIDDTVNSLVNSLTGLLNGLGQR